MLDQGRETVFVRTFRRTLIILMRMLFRIEHRGVEQVPRGGGLIIAPNHVTYFDPFWVAVRIHRTLRFMAWDRIFKIPVAGALFRWLGAFPVNLETPESSAYRSALEILQNGEALMIFPEGGRSPDGTLMPFKEGPARLALKTGAAILPVVIYGGARVWNRNMWIPLPRKVRIEYLAPIPCHRKNGASRKELNAAARDLTARLRSTMAARLAEGPVGLSPEAPGPFSVPDGSAE